MKTKDIPEELVDIMIEPYLNHGWEYTYWGKKILTCKGGKAYEIRGGYVIDREDFIDYVLEELGAKDYEMTPKDIDFPYDNKIVGDVFYAFLYMDKHDGDHYGVVIFHREEVERWIKDKAGAINKLLEITNEDETWLCE